MSDKSFCDQLFDAFLLGGYYAVIVSATFYLIDKINQHDDEIKELFSRLEKNHESSQDHELKK